MAVSSCYEQNEVDGQWTSYLRSENDRRTTHAGGSAFVLRAVWCLISEKRQGDLEGLNGEQTFQGLNQFDSWY